MSLQLSQKQISYLEEFIKTNEPTNYENILGNISIGEIDTGILKYRELKNGEIEENYIIFGESGSGYNVYALYKSDISNKIYVIYVSIQTPINYAIIENESEFYKFTMNYNESLNV
uniref:Uncharacterized protein n=1 Tax=viral metagenome TaxID=1070528 RepID=A0A6C0HZL7_9ZZZZ